MQVEKGPSPPVVAAAGLSMSTTSPSVRETRLGATVHMYGSPRKLLSTPAMLSPGNERERDGLTRDRSDFLAAVKNQRVQDVARGKRAENFAVRCFFDKIPYLRYCPRDKRKNEKDVCGPLLLIYKRFAKLQKAGSHAAAGNFNSGTFDDIRYANSNISGKEMLMLCDHFNMLRPGILSAGEVRALFRLSNMNDEMFNRSDLQYSEFIELLARMAVLLFSRRPLAQPGVTTPQDKVKAFIKRMRWDDLGHVREQIRKVTSEETLLKPCNPKHFLRRQTGVVSAQAFVVSRSPTRTRMRSSEPDPMGLLKSPKHKDMGDVKRGRELLEKFPIAKISERTMEPLIALTYKAQVRDWVQYKGAFIDAGQCYHPSKGYLYKVIVTNKWRDGVRFRPVCMHPSMKLGYKDTVVPPGMSASFFLRFVEGHKYMPWEALATLQLQAVSKDRSKVLERRNIPVYAKVDPSKDGRVYVPVDQAVPRACPINNWDYIHLERKQALHRRMRRAMEE